MSLLIKLFPRIYGNSQEVRYEFSQEDNLIGIASVFSTETSYCINVLGILPDYRGQGYGSEILETLLQKLNDKPITLQLDKGTPLGIGNLRAWYMRHGFVDDSDNWMMRQPKLCHI